MASIWTDESRYHFWLEIEILAIEALTRLKRVPPGVAARVRKQAQVNVPRIEELEKITRHDVAAFVSQVGETIGTTPAMVIKRMSQFLACPNS